MSKFIYLLCLLFIASCGNSIDINPEKEKGIGANISEKQASDDTMLNIDPSLIKSMITFDLLGGIFIKQTEDAQSIILSKQESHPTSPPQGGEASMFNIDYSNQYMGHDGVGRLVISAFGNGQEFFHPKSPQDVARHFSNLKLRFFFFDYAFKNRCLGIIQLDGEISCEIEGDYETKSEKFLGRAECSQGPSENPIPVLYGIKAKNYEIDLKALLKIDGNPYQFKSYTYEGEIIIDGEKGDIRELIQSRNSCF